MAKTAKKQHMKSKEHPYKMMGDKKIFPTLYVGTYAGHGTYMAGKVGDDLIVDSAGKPIPYRAL